jgi:hypothetical protein
MENQNIENINLASIDFTPDWAKKDAGVSVGSASSVREETPTEDRRRQQRDGDKPRRRFGDKKNDRSKDGAFRREERPRQNIVEFDVRILPGTKSLGTTIRKIQQDSHAYKLKDLAYFFLDNPSSVLLKMTPAGDNKIFQCKACGFSAMSEEEVVRHVVSAHIKDYYDIAEIECEAPKGNFSCVAKCGITGELLGPPNIREFSENVSRVRSQHCPGMSEQDYRSRIEMIRDTDVIEQWRASAVKKTVYRAKGMEGAMDLTADQAEARFKREILPSIVSPVKFAMIAADMAMSSPDISIRKAARSAFERERKAPHAIIFALRGAFHSRGLKFFRANDSRGQEFVSGVEYKTFDASHAIPELASIATFIEANPCRSRAEITLDDQEKSKQLDWLVSTGHVVAFTNGVFSAVEKHPKYGPMWRKPSQDKENEKVEATQKSEENEK